MSDVCQPSVELTTPKSTTMQKTSHNYHTAEANKRFRGMRQLGFPPKNSTICSPCHCKTTQPEPSHEMALISRLLLAKISARRPKGCHCSVRTTFIRGWVSICASIRTVVRSHIFSNLESSQCTVAFLLPKTSLTQQVTPRSVSGVVLLCNKTEIHKFTREYLGIIPTPNRHTYTP